jgi:hypothetical protein
MSFLQDLVREINRARANPSAYADKIEDMKKNFQGNILRLPDSNIGIKTKEGPAAYDECVRFLRSAESAQETTPSKGLTKIANELLTVVQKDPAQLAGVDMSAIIDKYGSFTGAFNRVMECGGATPEQIVMNLLVSDGETTRSQRNALLNKSLKRVGVASGKHDVYRNATIMCFCTNFTNSKDADDNETYSGSGSGSGYSSSGYKGSSGATTKTTTTTAPKSNKLPTVNDRIVEKKPKEPDTAYEGGVVSVDKSERVVVEGGKRKKKVTYTKHYEDGHTEKEVKFEDL